MSTLEHIISEEALEEAIHEHAENGRWDEAIKTYRQAQSMGYDLKVDICKHNRIASYCSKCENEVDEAIGN